MNKQLKNLYRLIKGGIVIFVVLSGLAGYALAEAPLNSNVLLQFLLGICLLSAGSLALNQIQESELDGRMPRTKSRPLPRGDFSTPAAGLISVSALIAGMYLLYLADPLSAYLGLATVLLYNGLYTMLLKQRTAYAAIVGAVPGALPVVMGYSAALGKIITPTCAYAFLIMFLWQLPHFWILALRYRADYAAAGIPVLPVVCNPSTTLRVIAFSTALYLSCALLHPLLFQPLWPYLLLVVPMVLVVAWEGYQYYRSQAQDKWFKFFLALNSSMLLFIIAPVLDHLPWQKLTSLLP